MNGAPSPDKGTTAPLLSSPRSRGPDEQHRRADGAMFPELTVSAPGLSLCAGSVASKTAELPAVECAELSVCVPLSLPVLSGPLLGRPDAKTPPSLASTLAATTAAFADAVKRRDRRARQAAVQQQSAMTCLASFGCSGTALPGRSASASPGELPSAGRRSPGPASPRSVSSPPAGLAASAVASLGGGGSSSLALAPVSPLPQGGIPRAAGGGSPRVPSRAEEPLGAPRLGSAGGSPRPRRPTRPPRSAAYGGA